MSAPKSKGFSQIPHGFHKRLIELKGARLTVWIAHRCMEGKTGESYPSLDRLMEYTGLRKHTITDARKWLRDNDWLVSSGQTQTERGRFSIPIEHTVIPETDGRKTTNGTESTTDGRKTTNGAGRKPPNGDGRKPPNGTDGRKTASSKPPTEVDPQVLEVDPKGLEVDPKKKEEREK